MLDLYKVLMLAVINYTDFCSIARLWELQKQYLYDDALYDYIYYFKRANHLF